MSRAIVPVLPPSDAPLCIFYATYYDDFTGDVIPVEGRFIRDPHLMTERLAMLVGVLAALPDESAPSVIAIDMIMPELPDTAPAQRYLQYALEKSGRVILAAGDTFEEDTNARPAGVYSENVADVGVDTLALPPWANTSTSAPLHAMGRSKSGDCEGTLGLAASAVRFAAPDTFDSYPCLKKYPIYFWSLYSPFWEEPGSFTLSGNWPSQPAHIFTSGAPSWRDGIETVEPSEWFELVKEFVAEKGEDGLSLADYIGAETAGRMVFVGAGQPDDVHRTPFSRGLYRVESRQGGMEPKTPGVVLHAMAAHSLMNGTVPLLDRTGFVRLIGAVVLGLVLCFLGLKLSILGSIASFAIIATSLVIFDFVLLTFLNFWAPSGSFLLCIFIGFVFGTSENAIQTYRRKAKAMKWVNKLLPASARHAVVEEIELVDSSNSQLKEQEEFVAVIRVDMANYTPFVFSLDAAGNEKLKVELLAEFFECMTLAVEKSGGDLGDLIGDGFVAIYQKGSEEVSARSAFDGARLIASAFEDWLAGVIEKLKKLDLTEQIRLPGLRIGVAASKTRVQFVGGVNQQRAIYIGGAFILSARLESFLKGLPQPSTNQSSVRLLISEDVRALADVAAEDLVCGARAQLKGTTGLTTCWEVSSAKQ